MDAKIKKLLSFFLSVIHVDISVEAMEGMTQFIKFCVIGLSNTLLSYFINIAVLLLMRPYIFSWDYIVGNIVAFALSVLWSFYWNNRFVFVQEAGKKRSIGKALLKTYIAYGFTGIILNNILSWIWIDMLGVSKYIAPFINLIISVPLNFIINKLWAFKSEDK